MSKSRRQKWTLFVPIQQPQTGKLVCLHTCKINICFMNQPTHHLMKQKNNKKTTLKSSKRKLLKPMNRAKNDAHFRMLVN